MKKIFSTILVCLTITSFIFSQNKTDWETWAENLAVKAERLAEKVSTDAERNAQHISIMAEDLASEVGQKFENGDFRVELGKIPPTISIFSDQETGYLGIHSEHISKNKAEKLGFDNKYGSYVSSVVKNSAADRAGLQPFDYIYGVNDQRTSNNQGLSDILDDYEGGEEVELFYIRRGEQKSVKVKLGDYADYQWDEQEESGAFLGINQRYARQNSDIDGVNVGVVKGSSADKMGIKDGDVIQSINGIRMIDWSDITTAIQNLSPNDDVTIELNRDGETLTKKGNVGEHQPEPKFEIGSGGDWGVVLDEGGSSAFVMGDGAFIGVYIEKISEKKARALGFDNPYGSYVTGVINNTGASKAGLMPFDYIYGIDEYRVGENQSLGGILKKFKQGDKVTIHFYRKGNKMSKPLEFLARSENYEEEKNSDDCQDPFLGIIEMSGSESGIGVKIKPVTNSTAKEMGLEEGDIITSINGHKMYDWMDIGMAIDMMTPGEKISVEYLRNGQKMSGSKNILSYAEAKKCKDCNCDDKYNLAFDLSKEFNIKVNPMISGGKATDEERDLSRINLKMGQVSGEEAATLTSKGVDFQLKNDLQVKNLKMEPNHEIGMYELAFDLETEGSTMIKVFNDQGRAIYEYDLGRFSGDFMDNVDISQNGAGTYYLQIVQDEKALVKKIILTNN